MVLIKHWNDTQSKYRFGDPPEALKKLMEKHKMKTSTLMRILDIDSRSLISDILNYKKGFSKKVIWKLSIHFNVPQETFNRPYKLKSESEAESESQRNQIYEGNDFEDVWGMHGAW